MHPTDKKRVYYLSAHCQVNSKRIFLRSCVGCRNRILRSETPHFEVVSASAVNSFVEQFRAGSLAEKGVFVREPL